MQKKSENYCKTSTVQVTEHWKSEHSNKCSKCKDRLYKRSTLFLPTIQPIEVSGSKIVCDSAVWIDSKIDWLIGWACFCFSCRHLIALEEGVHKNIGWYHCAVRDLKPHEAHINDEKCLIFGFKTNFVHALANSDEGNFTFLHLWLIKSNSIINNKFNISRQFMSIHVNSCKFV